MKVLISCFVAQPGPNVIFFQLASKPPGAGSRLRDCFADSGQRREHLVIVWTGALWQLERMEIKVTKPIEDFIERQVAKGYADANEVARQALLRWMEEEEFDPEPPQLLEKLAAARQGSFRPHNPQTYDTLLASTDEASR